MKKLLFVAVLFSLIFSFSFKAQALEFSLSGGSEIYSNGLDYGFMGGLHTPLKDLSPTLQNNFWGNLYLGLSGFVYQGKVITSHFSHFGGGADVGYVFAFTNKLRFIPLVFFGGCQIFLFQYEGNNLLIMDSLSYVFMPSLLLNYQVTPPLCLGFKGGLPIL